MEYVAKLSDGDRTVYGYGATDGAAVLDAVKAHGGEPSHTARLTVYTEYSNGAVDVSYATTYVAYCVMVE